MRYFCCSQAQTIFILYIHCYRGDSRKKGSIKESWKSRDCEHIFSRDPLLCASICASSRSAQKSMDAFFPCHCCRALCWCWYTFIAARALSPQSRESLLRLSVYTKAKTHFAFFAFRIMSARPTWISAPQMGREMHLKTHKCMRARESRQLKTHARQLYMLSALLSHSLSDQPLSAKTMWKKTMKVACWVREERASRQSGALSA